MKLQNIFNLTLTAGLLALTIKTQYLPQQSLAVTELQVEKITVLERDGKTRLQIANSHYSPPVVINGKELFHPGPRPGLIFFNDEGSENGGLIFMGKEENGKVRHGVHLSMDRYNQDQAVALQHIEQDGLLLSGLNIIDRPTLPVDQYMDLMQKAEQGDSNAKAQLAELEKTSPDNIHGARRAFYGTINDKALLQLNDALGKKRIELAVSAKGEPQLVFYREDGTVLQRLPDSTTGPAVATGSAQ